MTKIQLQTRKSQLLKLQEITMKTNKQPKVYAFCATVLSIGVHKEQNNSKISHGHTRHSRVLSTLLQSKAMKTRIWNLSFFHIYIYSQKHRHGQISISLCLFEYHCWWIRSKLTKIFKWIMNCFDICLYENRLIVTFMSPLSLNDKIFRPSNVFYNINC